MEKVWEELKKIEAQAEQIRSEAQDKSMQISTMAQKQAQTLSLNAKNYSAEENSPKRVSLLAGKYN